MLRERGGKSMNDTPEKDGKQSSSFSTSQENLPPTAEPIDYTRPTETAVRTRTWACTSMILGIVAVLSNCCCCGFPFGIAAIVFAAVDKTKNGRFDGMAVAGLVLGIVSIVMVFVMLALYVLMILLSEPVY